MAFAAGMPNRNKTLPVMAVADLHGIARYGPVARRGVKYVDKITPVLQGTNIPIGNAPLPPSSQAPRVSTMPQAVQQSPVVAVPNSRSRARVGGTCSGQIHWMISQD